jgi:hypothetical protein
MLMAKHQLCNWAYILSKKKEARLGLIYKKEMKKKNLMEYLDTRTAFVERSTQYSVI